MKKLTSFQEKALRIMINTTRERPIKAEGFARLMWPDNSMHTKSSNQGNGACRGKAAWLQGGSQLAKLRNKGWLNWHDFAYYISDKGKEMLNSHPSTGGN